MHYLITPPPISDMLGILQVTKLIQEMEWLSKTHSKRNDQTKRNKIEVFLQ